MPFHIEHVGTVIPLAMVQTFMDWGLVDGSGIEEIIKPVLDNPIVQSIVQILKYTSYILILVGFVVWPAILSDAHSNEK